MTTTENSNGRETQRRRPSTVAEAAMRKLGRSGTSTEDCRRMLQSSTTSSSRAPLNDNGVKLKHTNTEQRLNAQSEIPTTPSHNPFSIGNHSVQQQTLNIDAEKLLATTNSEDAIRLLQQSTSTTFTMSTEASKLISTLQLSPVPTTSPPIDLNPRNFKDYNSYPYNSSSPLCQRCPPTSSTDVLNNLCRPTVPVAGGRSGEIHTQYSSSTDEGCETDMEDQPLPRLGSYASSSSSSGVVTNYKSLSQNLSCDSSQTNFSMYESLDYQLSDDLTSSLPSCTSTDKVLNDHVIISTSSIHPGVYVSNSGRSGLVSRNNPLVYMSSVKSGARQITRSPVDFREGRRASDGLVAQQANQPESTSNVVAFNSQRLKDNRKSKGQYQK